eukprot:7465836-Lingulodinium_polyedra.AAC.1
MASKTVSMWEHPLGCGGGGCPLTTVRKCSCASRANGPCCPSLPNQTSACGCPNRCLAYVALGAMGATV